MYMYMYVLCDIIIRTKIRTISAGGKIAWHKVHLMEISATCTCTV